MRGRQPLPFLAIMTGLMAWKPSSDSFSIEGGWEGGCCLRYSPPLQSLQEAHALFFISQMTWYRQNCNVQQKNHGQLYAWGPEDDTLIPSG